MKQIKEKILIPIGLLIVLIIVFSIGIFAFIYCFNFKNSDSTMFIGLLTISLVLMGTTFSYGVSYHHLNDHKREESNIEYLKTMKEDVNNYLNHLNYLNNLNEKNEKNNFNKQIEYLFNVNALITNKLGKILDKKDKDINDIEKIQLRTNTKEDFKKIVNIINENSEIKNEVIKNEIIKAANFNLIDSNLSGLNLSGFNFKEANLRGANLSGADLSGADLRGANLNKTDLRGANLNGVKTNGITSAKYAIVDKFFWEHLDDDSRALFEKLINSVNQ